VTLAPRLRSAAKAMSKPRRMCRKRRRKAQLRKLVQLREIFWRGIAGSVGASGSAVPAVILFVIFRALAARSLMIW